MGGDAVLLEKSTLRRLGLFEIPPINYNLHLDQPQ